MKLNEFKSIPIDPDGKYVLLVHGNVGMKELDSLVEKLKTWLDTDDEPFFFIHRSADVDIRLEKVDD